MSTTTVTTTKQRRPRVSKGVLVTSNDYKTRNTLKFLESLNVKVITHFNAINYNSYGYKFANL